MGVFLNARSSSASQRRADREQACQQLVASKFQVLTLMDQRLVCDWNYYRFWIRHNSAKAQVVRLRRGIFQQLPPWGSAVTTAQASTEMLDAAREDLSSEEKSLQFWRDERRRIENALFEAVHEFHALLTRITQLFPNDALIRINSLVLTKQRTVRLPQPELATLSQEAYIEWANQEISKSRVEIEKNWTAHCEQIVLRLTRATAPVEVDQPKVAEPRVTSLVRWLIEFYPRVIK